MKKGRRKSARRNGAKMPFSVRFGILIAILVMIVAAAGVLMAPGFKVSEVYCEGNVNVKSEDIFSAAQIGNGKNILLVGIGKAERNVNKIPMVKDANIRRVFPNKICITVEERVPLAYIKAEGECAIIDEEMMVIKKEEADSAIKLIEKFTPDFSVPSDKEKEDKEEASETETEEETSSEGSHEEAEGESTENEEIYFNIPLVDGIELKNAEENKKAKCDDIDKLSEVIKLCVALEKAGLLGRATYINVTDMQNVNVVIENRLDVRLGNINNIEYRARFLAEVVNNKISAYETLILDYTGDDIYARSHDDGKERTKIEEEETAEDEDAEDTEDGTDTTDTDSDDENDSADNDETTETEDDTERPTDRNAGVGSL